MPSEGGKTDEVKGRAKEAAGAVLDDEDLRREGRVEQATGKVKSKVEKVVDKAKEKILGQDRGSGDGDA